MRLSFSFRIDKNDKVYKELKRMSKVSKDLYNQALFEIKSHYEQTGKMSCPFDKNFRNGCQTDKKILSYCELDTEMKSKMSCCFDRNFRNGLSKQQKDEP